MNAISHLDILSASLSLEVPLIGRALFQERRERAAKLWREVEPDRFYLGRWHVKDTENYNTYWGDDRPHVIPACGTMACALGWLGERQIDDWRIGGSRSVTLDTPSRNRIGVILDPPW